MLESVKAHREPWDVVVIGGGATGVGCALDAASRGLSVLLLEAADFGKGTSGRSTKLIHGGVRYLAQGNIALVREALRERSILRLLAPGHVKPLDFLIPCYSTFEKFYYAAGLFAYTFLAGRRSFGMPRILSKPETLREIPGVMSEGLRGAVRYHDAKFDDTRFLIDLAVTASERGAVILNYAPVTSVAAGSDSESAALVFRDLESGAEHKAEARVIVNAAGVFCADVAGFCKGADQPELSFSRGAHLVFERDKLPSDAAMLIPKTPDGRVLFAIPWHGRVLAGTTDTPVGKAEPEPEASEEEIRLILNTFSSYLENPVSREDIRSVFAGIRPLVGSSGSEQTSTISREHFISVSARRFVTVTGGKWTTYRSMAEETIDRAIEEAGIESGPSRTEDVSIPDRRVAEVQEIIAANPALSAPLADGFEYSLADVVHAVRNEMARDPEDVLSRRTRLLLIDAEAALEALPKVTEIMALELGWSGEEKLRRSEEFRKTAMRYVVSESDQSDRSLR